MLSWTILKSKLLRTAQSYEIKVLKDLKFFILNFFKEKKTVNFGGFKQHLVRNQTGQSINFGIPTSYKVAYKMLENECQLHQEINDI